MTVNGYLMELASELVIDDKEKEGIDKSIDTIKERLYWFFGSEVTDKIVFGSYTRGTILPRKADEDSDIDLMVVFGYNSNGYQPQTYLNKLKSFAEKYYSTSIVRQSRPSIVLELNHIKFELTPAIIPYGYAPGTYKIPSSPTEWIYTSPNDFNNTLIECNKENNYKIKPVVRLIKRWNVTKNYAHTASFQIEKLIANGMKYSHYSCSSYIDYLKRAFEEIRDNENYYYVDVALQRIDNALEYEADGKAVKAYIEIDKVCPDID